MSPATHFLIGWTLANTDGRLTPRERAAITLAGVVPDVDDMGIIWDLLSQSAIFTYYQRYHHVFGHNLSFRLVVAASGLWFGLRKRLVAVLMLASFHLHLLGDIVGARGQGDDFWAVPYFWSVSEKGFYWRPAASQWVAEFHDHRAAAGADALSGRQAQVFPARDGLSARRSGSRADSAQTILLLRCAMDRCRSSSALSRRRFPIHPTSHRPAAAPSSPTGWSRASSG